MLLWSVIAFGGGWLLALNAAASNCANVAVITESCRRSADEVFVMTLTFEWMVGAAGLLVVLLPYWISTRRR